MSHDEPTLPERRQAEVLARWLEGQPTAGELPDELDKDVIEAVLALRPGLAPAPSLTVDDILAGVQTGPLASPAPSQQDPVVAPAAQPQPANTPNRRWVPWAVAGVGSLAAAAAVLMVASTALLGGGALNSDMAALEAPAESEPARDEVLQTASPARERSPAPTTTTSADAPASEPRADRIARAKETSSGIAAPTRQAPGGGGQVSSGAISGGESKKAEEPFDAVADLGDEEEQDEEMAFEDLDIGGVVTEDDLNVQPVESVQFEEVAAPEAASKSALDSVTSQSSAPQRRGAAGRSRAQAPSTDAGGDSRPEDDLERRAAPTAPPAAETVAVQNLLAAGKAEEARASAQQLLDGGGLSDLRRADLYWALGKAHAALGQSTKARSAWREAVRLRQR